MIIVDVPIQFKEQFIIIGFVDKPFIWTCIIIINGLHYRSDSIHSSCINPGFTKIYRSTLVGNKVRPWIISPLNFAIHKEEQFISNQWTTKCKAGLVKRQIRLCYNFIPTNFITNQALVSKKAINRPFKFVGSTFGHRVDVGACKTTLAYVKRGNGNLDLFDGFERDRLCVGLTTGRGIVQTKWIIKIGAI